MKKLDEQFNGKMLLESCFKANMTPIELKEAFVAGTVGAWKCPLWKLGQLNLNGRVYPAELAQRLVNENKTTPVCDGHEPDYHQEFNNYVAVAKEPWIEGSVFGCNVYVIDEAYQLKLEKLKAHGLSIGVSSVGYGECDIDGVVNPTTYELVRYLDFVTYPAGEVYAEPKKEERQSEPATSTDEQAEKSADLSKAMAEALTEYQNLLSMEEKNDKRRT